LAREGAGENQKNGEEKMPEVSGEFWERLAVEPEVAYAAFALYRDQGLSRSLHAAALPFYSQRESYQGDTEGLPTGAHLTRFKRWSSEWMWVARCEAFDSEEDRQRSLRLREQRIKMHQNHFALVGPVLAWVA
jgi:hypothetical protein